MLTALLPDCIAKVGHDLQPLQVSDWFRSIFGFGTQVELCCGILWNRGQRETLEFALVLRFEVEEPVALLLTATTSKFTIYRRSHD